LVNAPPEIGDVILILVILFLGGLFLVYLGFWRLKLKRQIENTPTSKIRSLAIGHIEIQGNVQIQKRRTI